MWASRASASRSRTWKGLRDGAPVTPALYLAFIAATALLIATPGPNVALIVANSVAYGRRFGMLTVLAASCGQIPQIALTAFGMTSALSLLAQAFDWLRWAGVAYLLYAGYSAWRAPAVDLTRVPPNAKSGRAIFGRAFLVSMTNPKTLLFYIAFFPQFVSQDAPLGPQLATMAATFLVVAVSIDSLWALAALKARRLLASRGRLRNRIAASAYFLAGAGLAVVRRTG